MKTSTSEGKHGIQWTAQNQLDDLDFADTLPTSIMLIKLFMYIDLN
ncbi:unnamed protein product [Schistosoma margrebowiei]|uniref:Uncharacterized protein n=1 Tax=Schistosoma margrebowiei TaxID=48269 RepID=A0A183M1R8_9TREM|nr:unnamed protein product [Schistosoma margrebowiei]